MPRQLFLAIFVLAILSLPAEHMFCQDEVPDHLTAFEKKLYHGLKYRLIGPFRGGRSTTVTGIPGDFLTYYMGTTGGGVWKTTDAGVSWKNVSDGGITAGSIGAVSIAPSDPNIIYVGTGSACPRGNVSPGSGMFKSLDGGETWKHIGLKEAGQIAKIRIHPKNPDLLYVAVLGNVFGPGETRGVYKSENGGETWQNVLFINHQTGAVDLVLHPENPKVLFAGMWTVQRKPWTLLDGSKESGIWKTVDGGNSWKRVKGGLPEDVAGRPGITISKANPNRLWVIQETKDESRGGVYRSEDGGKSWNKINRDHKLRQRAWYYSHIFADPKDENTVYILNTRMYRSDDGGKTYTRIRTPHGDDHDLWINPANSKIMIESNDGGANISFNGGETWSTQNNQPTAEMYRVTVDNQFPYRVYGAQQDNSTITVPSKPSGGLTPQGNWYAVGGGESGHIAVHPNNPEIVYAGSYIGRITNWNRAHGHQRNINAYPQMHDGTAGRDIKYRFQWNAPIRISPHNPDILYHCSQYVHRSLDGGQSWETISPDLTTNHDAYQDIPGGPVQHDHTGVELYTTIFAFEESSHEPGTMWAGTDDGRLHITRDNGQNWTEITPSGLPNEATINTIDLSVHGAGRAIITAYKYRENDFRPIIFLTENYGKKWQNLADGKNGIPDGHFTRVVREDHNRKGLLFAGTEFGLYVSFDVGKSWKALQLNLPITPITDMLIKGNDLVIATQGRSFWILDDISPLRELKSGENEKTLALYKPAPGFRTQLRSSGGPSGPDGAPNGAILYFDMNGKVTKDDTVKIEITDSSNDMQVTYSSNPDAKAGEEKLDVKEGLNRFVWDLRFKKPEVQKVAVFSLASTSGPKAPPGEYEITISANDNIEQQTLTVLKDPRWVHTNEDLSKQYALTLECYNLLENVHENIGLIRDLRSQLKNISTREDIKALKMDDQINNIIQEIDSLEKRLIQTKSESGQDPINYPSMLDDQIAYLYSVVNSQDAKPTEGSYQRFEDLKIQYQEEIAPMAKIKSLVSGLNKTFLEKGISLIALEVSP